MMAAGRLHLETINRHQWAEEVAVPKLADPIVGESEQSAGTSVRQTKESQSLEGYQTTALIVGRRDRQRTMAMLKTRGSLYLGGFLMRVIDRHQLVSRSL